MRRTNGIGLIIMARTSTKVSQAMAYLEILRRIPRNSWITTNELHRSLNQDGIEISLQTLQRALKDFMANDSLGIECNDKSRPFGYRQMGISGLGVKLSPTEALMLRLVNEHLTYQMPERLTHDLKSFFDAARDVLGENSRHLKEREWLKKVAVVPNTLPFIAPKILPRIFQAVSEALFRNHKLQITYVNSTGKKTEKIVSPLGLVQQDVRIYLVCQFDGYDNYRHLALHRLQNAVIMPHEAVRPAEFSLESYVKEAPFNYNNPDTKTIRLTCEISEPATVTNLTETPMNRTQKITKIGERLWKLEVEIKDSLLLDGWLKTWENVAGIRNVVKTPIDQ